MAGKAAIINGVTKAASRYLSAVGVSASNADIYQDVVNVGQMMKNLGLSPAGDPVSDVANVIGLVSEFFFKKGGQNGGGDGAGDDGDGKTNRLLNYLKPPSVLSTVFGIHALERSTGAVATLGVRTLARGRPLGTWNGVIVRESRFTPGNAKLLDRLTGGRLLDAKGYYFHEGGRTWHAQSFTVNVQDTPKSLTYVRSFTIPRREHFFDRPLTLNKDESEFQQIGDDDIPRGVSLTRVIDVVKDQENARNIPGYIGSTGRLDNAAGISPLNVGAAKRTLFAARWLLEDESERDDPAARNKKRPPPLSPSASPSTAVGRGGGRRVYTYSGQPSDYWPTTTSPPTTRTKPAYGQGLFRSGPAASPSSPGETVVSSAPVEGPEKATGTRSPPSAVPKKAGSPADLSELDRYSTPDGKQYPLVVRRIVKNPITQTERAEAAYYDGELKQWRMVVDDDAKEWLAEEVRDGHLQANPDNWQKYVRL